jgi:hypothetical protein
MTLNLTDLTRYPVGVLLRSLDPLPRVAARRGNPGLKLPNRFAVQITFTFDQSFLKFIGHCTQTPNTQTSGLPACIFSVKTFRGYLNNQ